MKGGAISIEQIVAVLEQAELGMPATNCLPSRGNAAHDGVEYAQRTRKIEPPMPAFRVTDLSRSLFGSR